eukprot:g47589.t1
MVRFLKHASLSHQPTPAPILSELRSDLTALDRLSPDLRSDLYPNPPLLAVDNRSKKDTLNDFLPLNATASIFDANTIDTEDAPTVTAAAASYPVPPTADATLPTANANATLSTADANVAPPTASTASNSRGDSNTQSCWVFTITPDLPVTDDE